MRQHLFAAFLLVVTFPPCLRCEQPSASTTGERSSARKSANDKQVEGGIIKKGSIALYRLGRDSVVDSFDILVSPRNWDQRDWLLAGGIGLSTGLMFLVDDDIHDRSKKSSGFEDFGNAIRPLGQEGVIGITLGFYASGKLFHRKKDVETSRILLESLIINQAFVEGLKYSIGRARPRTGKGNTEFNPFSGDRSMPSGEASAAFTMATVIADQYDNWPAKVGAYALATAVSAGRIGKDAHWASGIALSAGLSITLTKAVIRRHRRRYGKKEKEASNAFIVYPGGVLWVHRF